MRGLSAVCARCASRVESSTLLNTLRGIKSSSRRARLSKIVKRNWKRWPNIIEKDLTLLGSTAIEDKLQVGVPRTIEQLMKANIAVWVLTGDKQDTAINIGQACSLITPQMKLRVINVEDLVKKENEGEIDSATFQRLAMASVKEQIEAGLVDAEAAIQLDADVGMVIDGRSLTLALKPELAGSFLALGTKCSAVICCRVSPLQKALVTTLVKDSGRITLAIGDGANDVGMIQAAHIGVGISGQEGMQAVMASDFAFAQFRFLERLLLLHGRYNYKRIARMVTYFFFKNIAFGLTIFIFNMHTNASGQTVYNDWLMSSFNIFFTNFPVLALGILDQDVKPQSSMEVPELYRETQANSQFTSRRRLTWFAYGVYVAVVSFVMVFYGIHTGEADAESGQPFGLWEVGTTLYTALLIALNDTTGVDVQLLDFISSLSHMGFHPAVVHLEHGVKRDGSVLLHLQLQDVFTDYVSGDEILARVLAGGDHLHLALHSVHHDHAILQADFGR